MRGFSADRRSRAAIDRRTEGRDGREPVAARPDAIAAVSLGGGPATGEKRRVVRNGAAQPGQDAGPARHVQGLHRALARHCGDGVRRGVSDPDPPDRPYQPQGPQQRGDGGRGRSRQPVCHRRRRRRPRCGASGIGHAGGFPRVRRGLQAARDGSRARFCRAVLAGPSLAQTASAMVQAAAGRLDALCRESAEEIRGHRQPRFFIRGCRRAVERACATSCCSGSNRA